ncbi:MAG: HAMP domain-containing protein [Alphaproteobacteria bacterium]|nr:MAG: HAMP domain-containing protein [Alphaproteobacteria bacterium]
MNKLLTLKKFLKVNTIFLIPLLLLILGLLYTNNLNLNIKNLSQTYFYVIFIGLIFPVIFLFYKVFKQIYTLFFQAKLKIAGYELHKKLAVLFSVVCLMPSIIISAFSIFTINTALEGWFSQKISTAVSQSVEVANKYLVEHQNAMKGEALEFAKILNDNAISFSSNQDKINKFLNFYISKNNLTDAVIIGSSRNVLARSQFAFEINYLDLPNRYYDLANDGKIIISNDTDSNKVNAFIKLDQYVDAYLFTSRFIDQKVLEAISKSNIASDDYKSIELNLFDTKISILVLFLFISLFLLLISLYVGLGLSNRLISPIAELIHASQEVGRGNLNYQIKNKTLLQNKISELKKLGNAFNKMVFDIKNNRSELIEANDQLDQRRQFSEAVLSGVYSGVIGLDKSFRINLPNKTAEKLLEINISKHYNKKFEKLFPEFQMLIDEIKYKNNNFVEKKIEYLKNEKKHILISRIVKQINENQVIGYVLTFEDITDLIHAQKLAAWSDVARKIAHEIKNPLTPIKLGAERIANSTLIRSDNKLLNTSEMILKNVDDIRHLIDEFSSFSRLPTPILENINYNKFIDDTYNFFKTSYPDIKFEKTSFNNIDKKIKIYADEKQLRQVIGNVIKNSSENFQENNILSKIIIFSSIIIQNYILFSIEDNGVGIKEANKIKILEPYFTTKKNGTGLGLAISKKIIEDHHGEIIIESSEKGTKVKIKFPIDNK